MPLYDRRCNNCGHERLDCYERPDAPMMVCECGGEMRRVWPQSRSSVIGDECEIWVKHGICNPDGTPRRYTSKSEMKREADKRGLFNRVEHVPKGKSGDSSPFTSRWV